MSNRRIPFLNSSSHGVHVASSPLFNRLVNVFGVQCTVYDSLLLIIKLFIRLYVRIRGRTFGFRI